jgi:RsiW-degrading membrane proteinase PrsW (M82 family)
MVGLIAGSALWLASGLSGSSAPGLGQAGAAVVVWICYVAVLTMIVVRLARSVRPSAWDVVLAALWGGLAAAALSQLVALATRDAIASALGPSGQAWTSAVAAPLPEEIFKAVGVLLILAARPNSRGPLCGMVLGAIVGIAFNGAEGLAFSFSELVKSASLEPLWSDLLVRGLLTGLVTHAGLTAIVGAGIGYLFAPEGRSRLQQIGVFAALLFVAVALHALIDSPLLDDRGIGGVVVKEVPAAVAVWFVGGRSRSEDVRIQRLRRDSTRN